MNQTYNNLMDSRWNSTTGDYEKRIGKVTFHAYTPSWEDGQPSLEITISNADGAITNTFSILWAAGFEDANLDSLSRAVDILIRAQAKAEAKAEFKAEKEKAESF